jgi:hypothetical protein
MGTEEYLQWPVEPRPCVFKLSGNIEMAKKQPSVNEDWAVASCGSPVWTVVRR